MPTMKQKPIRLPCVLYVPTIKPANDLTTHEPNVAQEVSPKGSPPSGPPSKPHYYLIRNHFFAKVSGHLITSLGHGSGRIKEIMKLLFEKQYSFLQRLVPLDDERAQELEGRVSILPPTLELIHKSHRLTGYLLLSFTAEWKDNDDLEVSTLLFSGDVNDIRYQYEKKKSFPIEPEPFAPLQNYLDAIAAAGSNGGSGGRGSGVVDDSSGRTRGAGGTAEDGEHFWILEINKNNWSLNVVCQMTITGKWKLY